MVWNNRNDMFGRNSGWLKIYCSIGGIASLKLILTFNFVCHIESLLLQSPTAPYSNCHVLWPNTNTFEKKFKFSFKKYSYCLTLKHSWYALYRFKFNKEPYIKRNIVSSVECPIYYPYLVYLKSYRSVQRKEDVSFNNMFQSPSRALEKIIYYCLYYHYLKKAYDSVPIGNILYKLDALGIKANVKIDDQYSESFNIMKGVRQGCESRCCGGLFFANDIVLCA
ncbi:hypothetical protein H8356DRAFT_1420658 [Neocallimastix lanati (nom. inval.)]|nr:hypothetical protein H8356DRAFT_1420658 [Neocallimastix sp. JGI-2020a]